MNTYTEAQLKKILKNYETWLDSKGSKGYYTNFEKAVLRKSNFEWINLDNSYFKEADLQGANFEGTILTSTNFYGADLQGANLKGAKFSSSTLSEANLRGATGLVIPKAGKTYNLIPSYYSFETLDDDSGDVFQPDEVGHILKIRGTQNENHFNLYDERRSSFDLLFLNGERKGQVWRGIEWWVLLTGIGEEIK